MYLKLKYALLGGKKKKRKKKFTQSGVHGFLLGLNEKKMKSEDSKHSINSGYYF